MKMDYNYKSGVIYVDLTPLSIGWITLIIIYSIKICRIEISSSRIQAYSDSNALQSASDTHQASNKRFKV